MLILQLIIFTILTTNICTQSINSSTNLKIKITKQPFLASNIKQLKEVNWTMLGKTSSETIYCISNNPLIKLNFVCPECIEKNFTDITNILTSAEDLTKMSGFPTIVLQNVPAKANWTGINIICHGKLNNKIFQSSPVKIVVQYIRQPYIVDKNNMKPNLNSNQGYIFYVNCLKSYNGKCQEFSKENNILKCLVEAHPKPTSFKWYKNGIEMSENGSKIEINTEMIGQSIQCGVNNGLHRENIMLESQAIQIFPLITPKIIKNNFKDLKNSKLYQPDNRINMKENIILNCDFEGNPKPQIFWKHRKVNGEIIDAPCLEDNDNNENVININNAIRVKSSCKIHASNYSSSGKYWCNGCFKSLNNSLECYPNLNDTLDNYFEMNIQGPPVASIPNFTIEMVNNNNNNVNVKLYYCSNPKPLLKKEVTFVIDQQIIEEGERWNNLEFLKIEHDNITPDCFIANLIIYSIKTFDKEKKIKLIVQNTFGKIDINIPNDFTFNGKNIITSSIWFTNGIVFFILLLIIIPVVLINIKKYILKLKKSKDNEKNKFNNCDKENENKIKNTLQGDIKDQNCIESSTSNSLNLPMIDDTLIYNDYADFKVYGTLKKQSIYFSQEAFV
ncbi:Immunoglobulin-like domain and Immunoglobulin-like fold domain-containing protein [Strongyloides ratti]|uniref:Immunoglobulin-like domain and Immunoglobulin-like fold domain-containing protein n=1 Tax=Strongyloides ratti TaxID=34506 RepID=A0A090LJM8_STRRB|nr:Immunoglobulin-like domain and Immunoglobulin-like fold domain-containing protein [Strongyloides ratti]CEF70032.1 Immunoglobulin-like domain and Immunoglobulin-like fold domain-containing protein [Strongyloides ratti]